MSDKDIDIERLITLVGAPPAAPMAVVRQQLEHDRNGDQPGLLPRLFGVISPKAGQ